MSTEPRRVRSGEVNLTLIRTSSSETRRGFREDADPKRSLFRLYAEPIIAQECNREGNDDGQSTECAKSTMRSKETSKRRARSLIRAAILCALGPAATAAEDQTSQTSQPRSFMAPPLTAFHEPFMEALLYNPPVDEVLWKDLDKTTTRKIEPSLVLSVRGIAVAPTG